MVMPPHTEEPPPPLGIPAVPRRPGRPPSRITPLVAARLARGYTQTDLARRLWVSETTVSRWEAGHVRPAAFTVERLAATLRLTTEQAEHLFDGYPARARDTVGRLPSLRRLLLDHDRTASDVSAVVAAPLATVEQWLAGRWAVPASALVGLDAAWGLGLVTRLPELRRQPQPVEPAGWLAIRREQLGLSQRALAEMIGVSRTTIGSWENRVADPPPWRSRQLARALRLDVRFVQEQLGSGRGGPPTPADPPSQLEALRLRTGLTAAQLGRVVGVRGGAVRRWETGRARPSRLAQARLRAIFGAEVEDLFATEPTG